MEHNWRVIPEHNWRVIPNKIGAKNWELEQCTNCYQKRWINISPKRGRRDPTNGSALNPCQLEIMKKALQ